MNISLSFTSFPFSMDWDKDEVLIKPTTYGLQPTKAIARVHPG